MPVPDGEEEERGRGARWRQVGDEEDDDGAARVPSAMPQPSFPNLTGLEGPCRGEVGCPGDGEGGWEA